MADENLAVIPEGWHLTFGADPQIIHLDHAIYRTSPPSIRLDPHVDGVDVNYCRECDGKWHNINVGDRILAKCWIFCGDSQVGDTVLWHGARLGLDLYAHTSKGYGIIDSYPHDGAEHIASVVRWGSKVWTQKTWDLIVSSALYNKVRLAGSSIPVDCDPVQIDSFVLWLDTRPETDKGLAWFADPELYINPTGQPPPATGCFIATACGTSNSHLDTLRSFRDRYLPNRLVDAYYLLSPPVADRIRRHENVKQVIRGCVEWSTCRLKKSLTL